MSVKQVMVSKTELGDVDPATGAITNWVEIATYENTLKIEEEPVTKTKHKQSGKTSPKLIVNTAGGEKAVFQMMDGDPDTALIALGGTVTTVSLKKTWNKPKGNPPQRIKALRVTTVDGMLYMINKGSITGRKILEFEDTKIALWEVEIESLDTGFPAIPDVSWGDA